MIHPSTEIRYIDDVVGLGVFATTRLAKGTITYVWDPLEIEILPDDPRIPGLMANARARFSEMVELSHLFVQSHAVIQLGHRQLVLIVQ